MIIVFFLAIMTSMVTVVAAAVLGYAAAMFHLSRVNVRRLEAQRIVQIMTVVTILTFTVSLVLFGTFL